jgi:O-methyltransferase
MFQFRKTVSTADRLQDRRDIAGGMLTAGKFDEAVAAFRAIYLDHRDSRLHFGEYCRALIAAGRKREFAVAAAEADFAIFDPVRPARMHDLIWLERQIYAEICCDVCQTPEAIAQLSRAIEYLENHGIEGDFVECGVYRGGSIICMIRTLQALQRADRDIWLYDTFEGMPKPEPIDRFYNSRDQDRFPQWDQIKRENGGSTWAWGPIDIVRHHVGQTGYNQERLHYIKGLVEETIPYEIPDQIALLRLDTDFYASTKHEFVHLYPRVVSGGVVIIDDYGAFEGSRKATDEYLRDNGIKVLLSRIDEHVRMFVKP